MLMRLAGYFRPAPARHGKDDRPGAALIFSRRERGLLLAAFTLLVMFRLPHAWIHGRFLDEEATVFLAYAWHRPALDALLRPFGGYLNLAANGTTMFVAMLAKNGILPLERAPYLTMIAALFVQVQPAVLILTGRAPWLSSRLAVIAALLVIAIAPATEELFFNVLHIQFHLALCVALILALDPPRRRIARIGHGLILFLAPLCGPGAIIVLPLFLLRALVDRDVRRLAQMAPLAAGAAIQMGLFYGSSPMRGLFPDPAAVAATLSVRLIALPLAGAGIANDVGNAIIRALRSPGSIDWWPAAIVAVLAFGTLLRRAARQRNGAIWLLLSGLAIAMATFTFGVVTLDKTALFNVHAGERYNFLPMVLIAHALIAMAADPRASGRRAHAALCAVMLIVGAVQYTNPLAAFRDGPSWPDEVAAWRRDHDHPLAVWPRPWTADLSDRSPACSPVDRDNPVWSDDPRYCESGWVSGFIPRPPSR
ncbi:MAG: hypothetical protein QM690_15610 [Sphingobium sp.]